MVLVKRFRDEACGESKLWSLHKVGGQNSLSLVGTFYSTNVGIVGDMYMYMDVYI